MSPLGAERGWRVVDNNVAAIELSAMMHEFAKSWQDSPVLGYSYGGRLVVVGSAETQRRASSVLQFIREQTAAGADNAMGGTQ